MKRAMANTSSLSIIVLKSLICFCWINSAVSTSECTWRKLAEFNGLVPIFGTFIHAKSRIDCGKECSKDSLCVSFFFTSGIVNGCQLLAFILPSSDGLTPSTNSAYYVTQEPVLDGYTTRVLSDGMYIRYRIGLTPLTHPQAEVNCASDGGHLVRITSAAKMTMIRSILQAYTTTKECYNTPSVQYTGTYSQTTSGLPCRRWDLDYYYPDPSYFPDTTMDDAGNYCRDPDNSEVLWCMVTETDYEYCDIMSCGYDMEHQADMCYHSEISTEYTGTWSKTRSEITCQRWDVQSPHAHTYTSGAMFPDGSVTAAENYCRDPDGSGYTWCYTTDPSIVRQPCHSLNCVKDSPERKCYDTATTAEYTGTWNLTSSGIVCKQWSMQSEYDESYFPDQSLSDAHNYCRDPDGTGILWCDTVDPSVSWEFCDIPKCDGSDGFHVQANNLVSVNNWLNDDETEVDPSAWAPGKPDYPDQERCARIDRKYDWYLNDGICAWDSWFICEKS